MNMHRLFLLRQPSPLRVSVSKSLKLICSIAIGSLLLTLNPTSASAARFTRVAVSIPAFSLPSAVAETLELSTVAGSIPTHQVIDLNAHISPTGEQFPSARFQVYGKNCEVFEGKLGVSAPAICTVIASRAGDPFSPIVVSAPALFSFGTAQAQLSIGVDTSSVTSFETSTILTLDTNTVTGLRKGQSLTLTTVGGSGSGPVHFKAERGESCIPAPDSGTVTTNYPVCTILPDVYGSVCSVVGNILTTTTSTICRVTAYKDGDSTFLPASSGVFSIQFGAGRGNQPIIVKGATTQLPLVISASPASAALGQTITVSLSGGSGTGAYNFALYQAGTACTITKSGGTAYVTRATAGNCTIQGLRSGDDTYRFATSKSLSLVWGKTDQTTPVVISNDPTTGVAGDSITLTAVGGQGGGAVSFRVVGNYDPKCVIVGDQLTRPSFGTCTVRATKSGDAIYSSQNSQDIVFLFYGSSEQAPLFINTNRLISRVGVPINLSTSGGSVPGAAVYQIVGGTGVGTITDSALSASQAGTFTVIATKQGDAQYASIVSAPVTFTFTV